MRALLLPLALLAALIVPFTMAGADVSDTISVVKDGETLTNAEIVARLSEATFSGPTSRVLIGREDEFADNMASAVLQRQSPLLLVPTDGPISARVTDLLALYNPDEVVLLGGEAAISTDVEDTLAEDFEVSRRSGPTRFETAIAIAEAEVPAADTAIIARAFGAPGSSDPSQAFADALAAGGWGADEGWPILLTLTEELPDSVASYLSRSSINNVMIMGGTAAISQGVQDRISGMGITTTRVAGPTRFDTAIAVAEMRGVDNASDADRVILVEGQSADAWAGGFAAAAHSAMFDAPVVLANGEDLPAATGAFLTPSTRFAGNDFFASAVLTCATRPSTCETARVTRGLPAAATVSFDPVTGSTIDVGSQIAVAVANFSGAHTVEGDCIQTVNGNAPGTTTVSLASDFSGTCTITSMLTLSSGAIQVEQATYTVEEPAGGIVTAVNGMDGYNYIRDGQEVTVLFGTSDTYTIDGRSSTGLAFISSLSVGDLLEQTAPSARQGAAVRHNLTTRLPADYESGRVGNVDLPGNTLEIIEPVSGVALRSVSYATGQYTVNGPLRTLVEFERDLNEGDEIEIVAVDAQTTRYDLRNMFVMGPAFRVAFGDIDVRFRIGSGGLSTSPNISDQVSLSGDNDFRATEATNQQFNIDGNSANYLEFRNQINNGDQISYARTNGIELFGLFNAAATPQQGIATETFDFFSLPSLTVLFTGGRSNVPINSQTDVFLVGGQVVSASEFQAAYTPGDTLTVTQADGSTPQEIALINTSVNGVLTDRLTSNDILTVSNSSGDIYINLNYTRDPFRVDVTQNRWYVNDVEVSLPDFETALDAATLGVATIRSTPASDDTSTTVANEHRLFTS